MRECSNRPNEVRSILTARGFFPVEAAEETGYYLIITHPMRITRLNKTYKTQKLTNVMRLLCYIYFVLDSDDILPHRVR